jgi:hypothetical protein
MEPTMTPSRPYLLRAFFDWLLDNDLTPHLVVNANIPHVMVPLQCLDGQSVPACEQFQNVSRENSTRVLKIGTSAKIPMGGSLLQVQIVRQISANSQKPIFCGDLRSSIEVVL